MRSTSALLDALKPHNLNLFFSNKYIYAQIVRSVDGHIVAAASTIEKGLRETLPGSPTDKDGSRKVGQVLAERAKTGGIDGVQWKRKKGQRYHGRIAALLSSMQDAGLKLI